MRVLNLRDALSGLVNKIKSGFRSLASVLTPRLTAEQPERLDASFYFYVNPDVADSGLDASTHYRNFGRREGRLARPTFWKRVDMAHWLLDRSFYLNRYPDVARAKVDPVWHYIYTGRAEGRACRRSFELLDGLLSGGAVAVRPERLDAPFYSYVNPDVAASGMDAVTHYRDFGQYEGRLTRPSLWQRIDIAHCVLDRHYYLKKYPDVARAKVDPVWHYIYTGRAEGRAPSPGFELLGQWRNFWELLLNPLRAVLKAKPATLGREQLLSYARYGKIFRLWIASRSVTQAAKFERKNRMARRLRIMNVETDVRSWVRRSHYRAAAEVKLLDHFVIGRETPRQWRVLATPAQFVVSVRSASVMGFFQVVSHRQFIHFEPAADPSFDFVAGQSHFVAPIKGRNEVFVQFDYESTAYLKEAVLIGGRCGTNYYHWLIEYLGRTHLIASDARLLGLPFIVDSRLYPQQLESLRLFFPNVKIYLHNVKDRLNVGVLHIPSIPTYLPDTQKIPLWRGSVLHKASLDFLRARGLALLPAQRVFGKRRIYLTRRVGRMVLNNEQVEGFLTAKGFEICDTGLLSFKQQIALFADASVIVGPLGAAFANVIFCDSTCRILGLVSPFATLFPLQARLAEFAGCDFKMLGGQQESYSSGDEDRPQLIAQDLFMGAYHIDIGELAAAVEDL